MTITAFTDTTSGARVFNASVFTFSCYLNGKCSSDWTVPAPGLTSQKLVQTMMKNVLAWIDPSITLATQTSTVTTSKVKLAPMKVPRDSHDEKGEYLPPSSDTGIPPVR